MSRLIRRSDRLMSRLRAIAWARTHRGVTIGAGVHVGRGCWLSIEKGARLQIGRETEVGRGSYFAIGEDGLLDIGERVFVGHYSTIGAGSSVEIGPRTFIGEMVSIRDHDHDPRQPPSSHVSLVSPVKIGADVWLGAKVTVLRGARVGDGVVIGANAVVRGEIPSNTLAVGVPARIIRSLD